MACCHNGSGTSALPSATGFEGPRGFVEEPGRCEGRAFSFRKANVTVSFVPNHAALPPVSRIRVPSWPCQKPRKPWCRNTSLITLSGVCARPALSPEPVAGTWILHFTSSTGVKSKLVNAPLNAPVRNSADSGRGLSRSYSPALKNVSRPTRSQKKREDVSRAAPTRGALIPRYRLRNPSERIDCLKQSKGPVYRKGRWSGWDCSRTLTVSKGYSMYLPAAPAI